LTKRFHGRMFLDMRTIRAALPRRRYPSDLPEGST
jgi:hypothetical protein